MLNSNKKAPVAGQHTQGSIHTGHTNTNTTSNSHKATAFTPPTTNAGAISVLLLPSDQTTITESAKMIFTVIAQKKDMFIYGGVIVDLKKDKGQYSLSQIPPAAFRSRIEGYGKKIMAYVAYKQTYTLKEKVCSTDHAKAVMASSQATEILPTVRIVTSCPILTTGLKVLCKGYHQDEGILVTNGNNPSDIKLGMAVKSLKGLLVDNEFVTESDKSRALSMMILPMMKMGGFITDPCPMDTAEANKSQSGKTYRQKVIAAIYNSSPLVVTQKNGGVGSIDESIGSALATGRPFILLDNFRGNFNSPMFEAIITTPESVPVRAPHKAEQIIDASAVSFQMSSNGVNTTPDMANRSCIIRIRKPAANKQWAKWPQGDLLAHVKDMQHDYLGCVISVIKAWTTAGRPKTNTTEHDMREWAQTMDWIIQNIFKMPPLLDGHQAIQEQVSNPQQTWLREVCIQVEQDKKLDTDLQAYDLAEICEFSDIEYPNKSKYNEDAANKYIGIIMAKIFTKNNSVIIDSYEITRSEKNIKKDESGRKKLTKVYNVKILQSDKKTAPCT